VKREPRGVMNHLSSNLLQDWTPFLLVSQKAHNAPWRLGPPCPPRDAESEAIRLAWSEAIQYGQSWLFMQNILIQTPCPLERFYLFCQRGTLLCVEALPLVRAHASANAQRATPRLAIAPYPCGQDTQRRVFYPPMKQRLLRTSVDARSRRVKLSRQC